MVALDLDRLLKPVVTALPFGAALAIGLVGALIARKIHLPLPWMMGPLISCLIASLLRAPIKAPLAIRPPMIIILGILLGSGFHPDIGQEIAHWGGQHRGDDGRRNSSRWAMLSAAAPLGRL